MSASKGSSTPKGTAESMAKRFPLIDDGGKFLSHRLDEFVTENRLAQDAYAVVTTMGVKGLDIGYKSTLLDHLFAIDTSVPPANSRRNRQTRGVWLARAKKVETFLLVMDLEREGDIAFEEQSVLLALAVSDVILINTWYDDISIANGQTTGDDIGQKKSATMELMRMVFEAFMKNFTNLKNKVKTTLFIVIHNSWKGNVVEGQVIDRVYKMWDSVRASSSNARSNGLADFFNVKVMAFPRFDHDANSDADNNGYSYQVETLRRCFSTQSNLLSLLERAHDFRAAVLKAEFSETASFIWNTIKDNKSLDLLALQGTISNTRPSEFKKKLDDFEKEWDTFHKKNAKDGVVTYTGFGSKVNEMLARQKSRYASFNTDEKTKTSSAFYQVSLENMARESVQPIYLRILSEQKEKAVTTFQSKLTSWAPSPTSEVFAVEVRKYKREVLRSFEDVLTSTRIEFIDYEREESKSREEILRRIEEEVFKARDEKIRLFISSEKEKIQKGDFVTSIRTSFESVTHNTWLTVRQRLKQVIDSAWSSLEVRLTEYYLDEAGQTKIRRQLETFGKKIVKDEAKKEASHDQAVKQMIVRFEKTFSALNANESTKQGDAIQKVEEGEVFAERARSSALRVLSVLAVIRLDEKVYHVVEQTLALLLLGQRELTSATPEQFMATSWSGIPLEQTLLSPTQCFHIWKEFCYKADSIIQKALPRAPLPVQNPDTDLRHPRHNSGKEKLLFDYENDPEWKKITEPAKSGSTVSLEEKVLLLVEEHISRFEKEFPNVAEDTTSYRVTLIEKAQQILQPIYEEILQGHKQTAIKTFEYKLGVAPEDIAEIPVQVRQLKWEVLASYDKNLTETREQFIQFDYEREESKIRAELSSRIDDLLRVEKNSKLASSQKEKMKSDLREFTRTVLESATDDTWSKVRRRLEDLVQGVKSYELDETTQKSFEDLETSGRNIVTEEARRQASEVVQYMKKRFERTIFFDPVNHDVSTKHQDPIHMIIAKRETNARISAFKVLSVLAVVQLNEETPYPVEQVLAALLLQGGQLTASLTASSWEAHGIPSEQTLLSPQKCSQIWIEFLRETVPIVEKALADLQESLPRSHGTDQTLSTGLATGQHKSDTTLPSPPPKDKLGQESLPISPKTNQTPSIGSHELDATFLEPLLNEPAKVKPEPKKEPQASLSSSPSIRGSGKGLWPF